MRAAGKLRVVTIEYQRMQRSRLETHHLASIHSVDRLAKALRSALELEAAAIDSAHIHGASSSSVQTIVSSILISVLLTIFLNLILRR